MTGRGELLRTVQARKGAAVVHMRLDIHDHDAGDLAAGEAHQPTTFVTGDAVTNRPDWRASPLLSTASILNIG